MKRGERHTQNAARKWVTVAVAALLNLLTPLTVSAGEAPVLADIGNCNFHLPNPVTTIAYDMYGAGSRSKYRFADQPSGRVGQREIKVPKRDAPLFLVLSAYDATEWVLVVEPGAEIAAILSLGYHRQIISNVPAETPVGFSSYAEGAGDGCPNDVNWDDSGFNAKLNTMLDREFSRNLDEHYSRSSGECEYISCEGDANHPDAKPMRTSTSSGGFWSRLFGSKSSPEAPPGTIVRAPTAIVVK